jgi:hypothetical protein
MKLSMQFQILKGTRITDFYRNTTNCKQDIHYAEHNGTKDLRAKPVNSVKIKIINQTFYKISSVQAYRNMHL